MRQKIGQIIKDAFITIAYMTLATAVSCIFFEISKITTTIALVYGLGVIFIAMHTSGRIWGFFGSVISVVAINYYFSEPYMKINFTMEGYPFTFAGMLAISTVTGMLMSHVREHQKIMLESEKEKMRANLLRAISHDLRTPLTGIISSSQACLENPDLEKRQVQQMLSDIYDDSNWLLNMVENILSVTRIGSGDTSVKTSPEPLEELVAYSVRKTKKRYPQANIDVKLPEEIVMVSVDSTLIAQVIINLLENAIKYSQSEEPITLKAEIKEKQVRVSVRDYGVGIAADRMKTLFDGTYILKDDRSDARRGMGIGLSLCKTIIVAHGGKIEAKNHEKGAEIFFYLPLEGE